MQYKAVWQWRLSESNLCSGLHHALVLWVLKTEWMKCLNVSPLWIFLTHLTFLSCGDPQVGKQCFTYKIDNKNLPWLDCFGFFFFCPPHVIVIHLFFSLYISSTVISIFKFYPGFFSYRRRMQMWKQDSRWDSCCGKRLPSRSIWYFHICCNCEENYLVSEIG